MELIPNAGLSLISFFKGVLGILFLLSIAYLLSNNRKAIPWKTVAIGLFFQIFIAIGVLKINFIKSVFETMGGFFIKVLEYTGEGTKMLLGEFGYEFQKQTNFHVNTKSQKPRRRSVSTFTRLTDRKGMLN